jgi:hypothetical protein
MTYRSSKIIPIRGRGKKEEKERKWETGRGKKKDMNGKVRRAKD